MQVQQESGEQPDVLEGLRKQRENELRLKMLLQQLLQPSAQARLNNIRLSNPDLYQQIIQLIIALFQQGRLKGKISEEQLKALVSRLLQERKETKITFMRK